MREIGRLNSQIADVQKKQADMSRRIATRTKDLHRAQQNLTREQSRERSGLLDTLKRQAREIDRLQTAAVAPIAAARVAWHEASYDAFICHASEDKEDLVRPLAEGLRGRGCSIWYDEFQLRIGDSLRRSIDRGLASSRFGIVVLSPHFFEKNWPRYELDGLVAREIAGGKVVLPIWHRVTKDDVIGYSPTLADRVALSTGVLSLTELIERLAEALKADA